MSVAATAPVKASAATANIGMAQAAARCDGGSLTAVLGSCIGLALYHPRLRAGAMAHIVLPDSRGNTGPAAKFADTAVDHLIKLLKEQGVPASGLIAKVAGGASMFGKTGPLQVGAANAQAVAQELRRLNIQIAGEHVGGNKGRRATLDTRTGQYMIEIVGEPPRVL